MAARRPLRGRRRAGASLAADAELRGDATERRHPQRGGRSGQIDGQRVGGTQRRPTQEEPLDGQHRRRRPDAHARPGRHRHSHVLLQDQRMPRPAYGRWNRVRRLLAGLRQRTQRSRARLLHATLRYDNRWRWMDRNSIHSILSIYSTRFAFVRHIRHPLAIDTSNPVDSRPQT